MVIEWAIACLAVVLSALAVINAVAFLRPKRGTVSEDVRVSVLIPARNEESNLSHCIASVLNQGNHVSEVLIYDDQSSDATRQIASDWAQRDSRVRLVETVPLPDGWLGKPHACYRLAAEARGQWLLFIDADARLESGAIERLLATAYQQDATFLSTWPAIEMHTPAEQILMPMLTFYVMTLYPSPLQMHSLHHRYALAHGSCILCRKDVYQQLDGHRAVRLELFEDTALARRWRAMNERALCCDGSEIVRVRMYRSVSEIWRGFQKNFYPGFRKRWLFPVVLALHALVFTVPFFAVVIKPSIPMVLALSSVLGARVVLSFRFKHPLWSVVLHPLAEMFLLGVGISSWWVWSSGRGVEWKQRRYSIVPQTKSV